MTTGERAQAILSEYADRYFFVVEESDGSERIGISDVAFARACLPKLEEAINKMEHHEKSRGVQPPPAAPATGE